VFFAFIGFDVVATTAEGAKNRKSRVGEAEREAGVAANT
jgi:hypothetical protein